MTRSCENCSISDIARNGTPARVAAARALKSNMVPFDGTR